VAEAERETEDEGDQPPEDPVLAADWTVGSGQGVELREERDASRGILPHGASSFRLSASSLLNLPVDAPSAQPSVKNATAQGFSHLIYFTLRAVRRDHCSAKVASMLEVIDRSVDLPQTVPLHVDPHDPSGR